MLWLVLGAVFLLLMLSAFFSGSETAFTAVSSARLQSAEKEGDKKASVVLRILERKERMIGALLLGNNLVNISGSALATSLAISHFKSNAVGISTGIMTLLILIFGEIFPKSFANHNNILVARGVIYPLYWLSKLLWPLIFALNFIPRLHGSKDNAHDAVTEDELMTMVEVVEEEGEIKEEEKEYITNIFEFDDTSCSEIMTPRADMFVIEIGRAHV